MIKKVLIAFSIVTLLLLVGSVGYFFQLTEGDTQKAKLISTQHSMESISLALTMFQLSEGRLPTEDEGIKILHSKGILTDLEVDSWGNPFVYSIDTTVEGQFKIESYAADSKKGGDGSAADLSLEKNVFE
ncbi:MAG: type II secretion system protein GspG [Kangiellaceae bacterium]|nr:type II secretion system protein GspG [Kangiellaceae bacterium]